MTIVASEVSVARAATAWLSAELAALSPASWDLSGACGVWSVAEVVAHLAWGADFYVELIRHALAEDGTTLPDEDSFVDRSAMHAWLAVRASEHRREAGEQLLDVYQESGRALVDLFESLTPEDWGRTALHPAGPRPVRHLLGMRIVELCIHGWEILQRVGRAAALPPGSQAVLIDRMPARLAASFVPRGPLAEPLRFRFVLTSPLQRIVLLTIYGDRFELAIDHGDSGSDAVITLHPDTFILACMGRLTWREAIDGGTMGVTGHHDLVAGLGDWFR